MKSNPKLHSGSLLRSHGVGLALLTILAGIIRFYRIGHPPLWYDESMVFWRTCGTYGQLLDCLRTDGFVPLHYSLIWWIRHPWPLDDYATQWTLNTVCVGALLVVSAPAIFVATKQRAGKWWLIQSLLSLVILGAGFLFVFNVKLAPPISRQATAAHRPIELQATPLLLRFVPALCGTLMVPAVYFLSRQLLPRKTSLLAAAFTACSAFTLFYSRDAKMYMDAWLFVTLNLGCLFWWFRSGSFTAWLCWIACGAAACGLQITSAIPVAISLLLLFTQNKMRWQQTLLWLLGVLLILSGPIGHYEKFNIWIDQVEEDGWQKSQLQWINAYNYGRTGPELLRYLGTSVIMGWEWPHADAVAPATPAPVQALKRPWYSPQSAEVPKIPRERFTIPATVAEITLAMLVAGCLPWPRRWRDLADSQPIPQPRWRVVLWLSLLIVVPVYGFYCRSMPDFSSPLDWWDLLLRNWPRMLLEYWWFWLMCLIVLAVRVRFLACPSRMTAGTVVSAKGTPGFGADSGAKIGLDELTDALKRVIVFLVMIFICWGIAIAMAAQAKAAVAAGKPWESLWVPRYIGFIWPAFAMAVAVLIMRLPTRPVRIFAVAFLLGINLAVAGLRIFGQTEPPVDLMARDSVIAQDPSHHTLVRMDIAHGEQYPGGGNLFSGPGEYYLDILSGTPVDPPHFKAAIAPRERATRGGFSPFGPIVIPSAIDRLIVWNQYDLLQRVPPEELLPRLDGWKLVSDSQYEARDCWIWADIATYRRREYVRE